MTDQEKDSTFSRFNPFHKKDKQAVSSAFNLNEDESMQASHEVIESIVHSAAEGVKGVNGLRDGVIEKATSIFNRKSSGKGVVVTENAGKLIADIFLYVNYGTNVVKVSRDVQTAVKTELSAMTELSVGDINIHVLDVVPAKTKAKTKTVDANHLFDKKPKQIDETKKAEPKKTTKKAPAKKTTTSTKKKNSSKND